MADNFDAEGWCRTSKCPAPTYDGWSTDHTMRHLLDPERYGAGAYVEVHVPMYVMVNDSEAYPNPGDELLKSALRETLDVASDETVEEIDYSTSPPTRRTTTVEAMAAENRA